MSGHQHACPTCAGVGTIRVRGLPGYQLSRSDWIKATLGAIVLLAVAYPLLVVAIVAGQP